jgi:hypothetical protein
VQLASETTWKAGTNKLAKSHVEGAAGVSFSDPAFPQVSLPNNQALTPLSDPTPDPHLIGL